MKYLLFLTMLALAGCEKEKEAVKKDDCPVQLNKPFTLDYGQSVCVQNENLSVGFDSLVNESRCPPNLICVTSGYAKIKVTIQLNETNYPVYLYTVTGGPIRSDTLLMGYRIKLQNLTYYPARLEDHKAQLIITK